MLQWRVYGLIQGQIQDPQGVVSGVSGLELRRGSGSMGLGYNALGSHRNEDNEFQVPEGCSGFAVRFQQPPSRVYIRAPVVSQAH